MVIVAVTAGAGSCIVIAVALVPVLTPSVTCSVIEYELLSATNVLTVLVTVKLPEFEILR